MAASSRVSEVVTISPPSDRVRCVAAVLFRFKIRHQIRNRNQGAAMLDGEAAQSVQPHHFSVVVHKLCYHAHGLQARQPAQVHGRLGVAGTFPHSPLNGAEGKNMPGTGQGIWPALRVGQDPGRQGAVRGGNSGAHTHGGVAGHGVGGALGVFVDCHHWRQRQGVGPAGVERYADHSGAVADCPAHQRGGGVLGGKNDVAFVLAVLVVHHQDGAPGCHGADGVLDRIEAGTPGGGRAEHFGHVMAGLVRDPAHFLAPSVRAGSPAVPSAALCAAGDVPPAKDSRRSVYFARTSTPRFTWPPGVFWPRPVSARVVGMSPTSNQGAGSLAGLTAVTVRETPSTAMDPFSAMYRASPAGTANRSRSQLPSPSRSTSCPTPSTWPWTTWPSNRPPAGTQRSRLTGSPAASSPIVLRIRVSPMTSTLKSLPSICVAVRQTPLTAMEAPRARPSVVPGACSRTVALLSPLRSTDSTFPCSAIIPVNINCLLRRCPRRCGAGWYRMK